MHRIFLSTALVALAAASHAQGVGGMAQVTLIDRDTGAVMSPHYYRGEYWVAGSPGARYAIQIRNRLGERLLAVTSVDGVNVVSGATAGWDQAGYVFSPGEHYQITGWRKTDAEIAAFTFTDSPNSYAARTGRPANVGVIGVAIFRERPSQPVDGAPMIGRSTAQSPAAPTPIPEASRAAPSGSPLAGLSMDKSEPAESARATNSAALAPPPAIVGMPRAVPAPKLGTGHGEREYSYITHTDFQRLQQQPNEVIRIHYDSYDNLLAMGIVARAPPAPPGVNPFPASPDPEYVPDPRG